MLRPHMWLPSGRWKPPIQPPLGRWEAIHATAVRKAEAASVMQTSKLQQDHQETMQTLEDEAIEEEKCACQSFLQACGAALQACPIEGSRGTYVPHAFVDMEHVPHQSPDSHSTIRSREPIPSPFCPRRPATATQSARAKWQHLPELDAELDPSGDGEPISCHRSHPNEGRRRRILWQNTWGVPVRKPSASTQTW